MSKTVIISIHGIMTKDRTGDNWQDEFAVWLEQNRPNVIHLAHSYGWLGPINSWLAKVIDWFNDTFKLPRWTRSHRIKNFKRLIREVVDQYGETHHIHILAHSFGTFLTTEALQELAREIPGLFINSVTLVAGIVSSKIDKSGYDKLLQDETVGTFHSWSSYSDEVVRYIAIPPFGHLGYWGIIRPKALEDRSRPLRKPYKQFRAFNNHTEYEHSGYFKDGENFYPIVLKSIKDSEQWEDNRKKRKVELSKNLYRKLEKRGKSTRKRK